MVFFHELCYNVIERGINMKFGEKYNIHGYSNQVKNLFPKGLRR